MSRKNKRWKSVVLFILRVVLYVEICWDAGLVKLGRVLWRHHSPQLLPQGKCLKRRGFTTLIDLSNRIYAQKSTSTTKSRLLTPTLAAWPLRGHTGSKSILWETLFLDHLHDFCISSLNSFLYSFLKSKFI